MGIKADFKHYHGNLYEGAYIRLNQPIINKTDGRASAEVYASEEVYRENVKPESLETLTVNFDYDYASNIYELAYAKIKELYTDRLSNIEDV